MPAFLPLDFSKFGAQIEPVDISESGKMSHIAQAFELEPLSQKIQEQLQRRDTGLDHAIPHIGAYVEYLQDVVLQKKEDEYVQAWKGILTMLALNHLYNFNLRIGKPQLNVNTKVGQVYSQELEKLGLLQGGNLYVLYRTVNGRSYPLAVLHPQILLCPLKNIDPRALANVPWYVGGQWHDVAYGSLLPMEEKLQFAAWLKEQCEAIRNAGSLAEVLTDWMNRLRGMQGVPPLSNPTPIPYEVDNAAQQIFGAINFTVLCSLPNYAVPVSAEVFTDTLLFTNALSLSTTTNWNLVISDGHGATYCVVPPIRSDFARLLAEHQQESQRQKAAQEQNVGGAMPDLALVELTVSRDQFASKDQKEVEITLLIRNGAFTMRRSRTYSSNALVFVQQFPYFSLWPYVNLAPQHWKNYIISMVPLSDITPPPSGCTHIEAGENALGFMGDSVVAVTPQDNPDARFYQRTVREYPWFIPLQYTYMGQLREGGCLITAPEGTPVVPRPVDAHAAIDFGTSNSVCAVALSGSANIVNKVLNGDHVKGLTLRTAQETEDQDVEEFHRYHGPSRQSKPYKFPSIAQLYSANNEVPLINGQIRLAEGGVIDYFAAHDSDLQKSGIYSNLKSVGKHMGEANTVLDIFIRHLTLLCALEAKLLGAKDTIHYYFSYPNESYKRSLEDFWKGAINYINGLDIFSTVDQANLTECEAASYFVQNLDNFRDMAAPGTGFAVADIGGGTCDMTVWRDKTAAAMNDGRNMAQKCGSLSFQYAGNQLFSRTFFTYFKQHINELDVLLPRIFDVSTIRDAAQRSRAQKTVESYIRTLRAINSTGDPRFLTLTALLNTLVEEPGINMSYWTNVSCTELRTLIYFKLKGILYVLGHLIRESDGVNHNYGDFKIFLVGGGSMAYDMTNTNAFDSSCCDMLRMLNPQLKSDPQRPLHDMVNFSIKRPQEEDRGKKLEVANGMLKCKMAGAAAAPQEIAAARPQRPITARVLREMYNAYIQFAVKDDPQVSDLLPRLELPQNPETATAEQNEVYVHYRATYENLWRSLNLDKDVAETVRLAVFSVLMAEELLG